MLLQIKKTLETGCKIASLPVSDTFCWLCFYICDRGASFAPRWIVLLETSCFNNPNIETCRRLRQRLLHMGEPCTFVCLWLAIKWASGFCSQKLQMMKTGKWILMSWIQSPFTVLSSMVFATTLPIKATTVLLLNTECKLILLLLFEF